MPIQPDLHKGYSSQQNLALAVFLIVFGYGLIRTILRRRSINRNLHSYSTKPKSSKWQQKLEELQRDLEKRRRPLTSTKR